MMNVRFAKQMALAAPLLGSLFSLLSLLEAPQASAQSRSVQLNQFRSAETAEDGFAVSRPDDRGHLRLGAQVYIDYGMNPLVYEERRGDAASEALRIVETQLTASGVLSLGLFDRLVLFAGLPVNIVMEGQDPARRVDLSGTYAAADGAGLSDVWAGARLRLIGERSDVFAAALQLTATFPTASAASAAQVYSGEQSVTFLPKLLLELRGGGWRLTANAGARLRSISNGLVINTSGTSRTSVDQEFVYAAGLTIPLVRSTNFEMLTAHIEAYGATSFDNFGDRERSPLEAIAGLRLQPVHGLVLGAAAGPGITRGYGTPDLRVIGTIGYAEPVVAPAVVEEEVVDVDSDDDGIFDSVDRCPNDPEDRDGFEDDDGCPDPDNDQDGVLDVNDRCPNEAEDRDGFEDEDGCPDPDNDQDGILDGEDGCPLEPEDRDGFEDENGCPDPDNDGDRVLDAVDRCPLDPGQTSDNPEENGCPRTIRVDREAGTIIILQKVEFASGRDVILDRSFPILEEVRQVLSANPQIRVIRIEGHTDDRGRDATNLELSRRRAASVTRWLGEHGIAGTRVQSWGCGELHPIQPNSTNDGRQANRRVEFHIIDPAPPGGARTLPGCVQAQ